MIAEIIFGYLTNSMALLADGWHMGTHALALSLTFFASPKNVAYYEKNHVMAAGYDENGDLEIIYFSGEISGFALHIVKK